MNRNQDHENFKEFLDTHSEPPLFDAASLKSIAKIRSDLVHSPVQLASIYLGFSVLGYFGSLFVCAQNSLGLSRFSYDIAHQLHQLPDPWCPIVCGAVFTGIPFLLSAFCLNRFQHRYLIYKMWWFFGAVPLAGTAVMLLLPHKLQHSQLSEHLALSGNRSHTLTDTGWMTIWALSAILIPYILEALVYWVVKPKKLSKIER